MPSIYTLFNSRLTIDTEYSEYNELASLVGLLEGFADGKEVGFHTGILLGGVTGLVVGIPVGL